MLPLCLAGLLTACAAVQDKPAPVPATARVAAPDAPAEAADKLPAYRRVDNLQGTIQLSGSSAVATFARVWSAAFQRVYPNTRVGVVAKSSGAAIADMAANAATIGMTSRALTAAERESYSRQHGSPPLELRVAIDAVAIFVFKDNPLKSISMPQLERIFAATPRSGPAIERWGEVGLEGDWRGRSVNGIGFETGRGAYEMVRELVLRGGDFRASVSAEPVSTSVVQAVGVDPGAIGYASVYYRTARTRVLPVQNASGEVVEPTESTATSGRYPLARYLYLHLGAARAGEANDLMREFLRFVLSQEGQSAAHASGGFSITPELAFSQRALLAK